MPVPIPTFSSDDSLVSLANLYMLAFSVTVIIQKLWRTWIYFRDKERCEKPVFLIEQAAILSSPHIKTTLLYLLLAAIIFTTASHLPNTVLPVFIFTTAEIDQYQANINTPLVFPTFLLPTIYLSCFACPPNSTSGFSRSVTATGKSDFNFNGRLTLRCT